MKRFLDRGADSPLDSRSNERRCVRGTPLDLSLGQGGTSRSREVRTSDGITREGIEKKRDSQCI